MKRQYVLGILFFSSLWGICEAVLGGALYRTGLPHASVPLTIVALVILSVAKVYLPRKGTAILIAAMAMLYKFLNAPFFACHLLAILLTGVCFELFFSVFKTKSAPLSAVLTAYASYGSFAVLITYVFRYQHWIQTGFSKLLSYIAFDGTIVALVGAALVPLAFRLAQGLKAKEPLPFGLRLRPAQLSLCGVTAVLWVFGVGAYLLAA